MGERQRNTEANKNYSAGRTTHSPRAEWNDWNWNIWYSHRLTEIFSGQRTPDKHLFRPILEVGGEDRKVGVPSVFAEELFNLGKRLEGKAHRLNPAKLRYREALADLNRLVTLNKGLLDTYLRACCSEDCLLAGEKLEMRAGGLVVATTRNAAPMAAKPFSAPPESKHEKGASSNAKTGQKTPAVNQGRSSSIAAIAEKVRVELDLPVHATRFLEGFFSGLKRSLSDEVYAAATQVSEVLGKLAGNRR